ncbi:MAG: hypothetical protein S4CHLAM45_12480 [Chlamydiales bacterium]|nr:hypothetical protein [Chlamydiales bacterium]MCH9619737.1 hypothetical protein [Chlamydiales bacterium]MCH9623343.1 hypothetical protein [Chlamydiales bacterium]
MASVTLNQVTYLNQIPKLWSSTLRKFNTLIKSYVFFNLFFLLIAAAELAAFISFFTLMSQSSVLAFTLAIFFLTLFSYFVLRLYLLSKKPDFLMDIVDEYLDCCRQSLRYQEGIPEHHIALANAAQKLAHHLHEKEYSYYAPPFFLKSLAPTLEKFSCFCHWKDLHRMKELLLETAIDEHIKVVKCEPTNLEVHAALANTYVTYSSLYADPSGYHGVDEDRWIPPERSSEEMQEKFLRSSTRAIEEFHILSDYAPNDPWVHMQLAYSYHDLQMPEEEIREYETVLKLRADDKETLFKLGMLYFQQGKNAKGLRIYETLKHSNFKKAESLIKFYGAYDL